MKVAIIGTGYVGLPTGIGLSELGNQVVCIDKIEEKIRSLQNGKATIYEDGMEDLFQKNLASGRLSFTTDMRAGVKGADVVMIAVGTPPHPVTKEADLQYIYAAAGELAPHLDGYTVVATKSTGRAMRLKPLSAGLIRRLILIRFLCRSFYAKVLPFMIFSIPTGLLSGRTATGPDRFCLIYTGLLRGKPSFCWSAASRPKQLSMPPMPFWR